MYNPAKPYKQRVLQEIKSTWRNPVVSVQEGVYPLIKRKAAGDFEVDHTDGIGTKGLYHWQQRTFHNAVLDALAMNVNDLILVRATAYKLQNHLVLPEDDEEAITQVVSHLAAECQRREIAMTGGETSIQNLSPAMDLSITISGSVSQLKPNQLLPGDTLIGLPSSGLHANGFTKVREVFGNEYWPEFTTPTAIYTDRVLPILKQVDVHGMMHITGGAFTKIKELLTGADAIIHARHHKPPKIFFEMQRRGVREEEMYQIFNCGIGFVISVDPRDAKAAAQETGGTEIGEVVEGKGNVLLTSAFSGRKINL